MILELTYTAHTRSQSVVPCYTCSVARSVYTQYYLAKGITKYVCTRGPWSSLEDRMKAIVVWDLFIVRCMLQVHYSLLRIILLLPCGYVSKNERVWNSTLLSDICVIFIEKPMWNNMEYVLKCRAIVITPWFVNYWYVQKLILFKNLC